MRCAQGDGGGSTRLEPDGGEARGPCVGFDRKFFASSHTLYTLSCVTKSRGHTLLHDRHSVLAVSKPLSGPNAATQHTPPLRRTKIYHASPPACPATPPASPSISSQTCPVVLKFVNFILSETDAIRSGSSPAPFFSVKSDPASSRAFATSVRWKRAAMCNGVFPCRSL